MYIICQLIAFNDCVVANVAGIHAMHTKPACKIAYKKKQVFTYGYIKENSVFAKFLDKIPIMSTLHLSVYRGHRVVANVASTPPKTRAIRLFIYILSFCPNPLRPASCWSRVPDFSLPYPSRQLPGDEPAAAASRNGKDGRKRSRTEDGQIIILLASSEPCDGRKPCLCCMLCTGCVLEIVR